MMPLGLNIAAIATVFKVNYAAKVVFFFDICKKNRFLGRFFLVISEH